MSVPLLDAKESTHHDPRPGRAPRAEASRLVENGPTRIDAHDVDHFGVYLSSIVAMTAISFILAGAPIAYTFSLTWGLALGAMAAIWIGPGFGLMIAGARIALIEDRLVFTEGSHHARNSLPDGGAE